MGERLKVVYEITYPNGKVYIGLDLTGTAMYFGSPSERDRIAEDLGEFGYRDFTVRKRILWESWTATEQEARAQEVRLIRERRANDPDVGYNRWPKYSTPTESQT